jgi:hypothetical protein
MKYVLFQISGGIGKCIAATAVCSAIKKKFPERELIVVSGYPEVFLNNPNVKKSYAFGNVSYFYQDYVEGKDIEVLVHDPYLTTDGVKESKHLIEIWCDLYNLPYNNENPELFITQRELDAYQSQVRVDKPIMIMQTNGGGDVNKPYSWARDLPSAAVLPIIEEFRNYYAIVHVRREEQQSYHHTIQLTGNLRHVLAVTMLSEKRLVIDSFLQHALAALNLPAVACWVVNTPKLFGYDLHTHIFSNPFTVQPELRNAYLQKFNIGGDDMEFPYNNEREIFDVDAIIKALKQENVNQVAKPINDGRIILPS